MILNAIGDSIFNFLPIILGYTAAKKFNVNVIVGMIIGATLCYPTIQTDTLSAAGKAIGTLPFIGSYYTKFIGIPFVSGNYTSTVVPVICIVALAAQIQKIAKKFVPEMLQNFFVPFFVLIISLPIGLLVIGPVVSLLTTVLSNMFAGLYAFSPIVTAFVIGALWQCLVIFGLHWALVPMAMVNIGNLGYDTILPGMLGTTFAATGVLAAMYLKLKDENKKALAIPGVISAFCGVTEPAIYGFLLPEKTPFVFSCIGGLKAMDRLSKQQELAWLQTLYSKYVLTAEERISLEEKIYSLKKSIQDEEAQAIKTAMNAELELLEHRKQLNQLSAEDELAWLQRINNKYKMSVEDRRSMEVKLYQTKKAYEEEIQKLQQETLDKAINALSTRRQHLRITYEEEIKQLRKIYNTYKLTAEQQQQVLEQIRSVSSSARSDRSSQFSNMADGVVEALKNQYQEQRDAEEKVINDSIESWQKWEDETTSAIQAQIDALDDLADAESSEKERQEYENKRQATELLLAYEKDDYNRKQYIKELNRLDNEESKRLADEQREAQKKELQAQIDSAKEQSSKQQEILQAELDAIAKNYDKLMSQYSLENSAYKKMLSSSQNEIVAFIASYAPEYELLGQTLGEKLYRGLKNKIQNIDYYFKNLGILWQYYSNTTSKVANEAVDKFWASRQQYQQQLNNISAVPEVNLTVNFNEPVESPVQVARKMEEVTQKLVAQLKQ